MPETEHSKEGFMNREPLVVAERIGNHPEWVVTEGLVKANLMPGPIRLPRTVAQALERADERLTLVSNRFNYYFGSFRESLGLYLLAGMRQPESNCNIKKGIDAVREYYKSFAWGQRPLIPYNNPCLNNNKAHVSGRGVDVALVYKESGFLAGGGYCYGLRYYDWHQSRTFAGYSNFTDHQMATAHLLLTTVMAGNDFKAPAPNSMPWHFSYVGDL